MFCERCQEHKTDLSVLSRLREREHVCVDCFCKEKVPTIKTRSKESIASSIKEAMDLVDDAIRQTDELYPDLNPSKYVVIPAFPKPILRKVKE